MQQNQPLIIDITSYRHGSYFCFDNNIFQNDIQVSRQTTIGYSPNQKYIKIEIPAKLNQGIHGLDSFGCFSYYGANFDARIVESIGRFTIIENNVTISSHSHCKEGLSAHPMFYWPRGSFYGYHNIDNLDTCKQNVQLHNSTKKPDSVKIGNDVWIGNNVIILNDVTIGDGAVIAAGSVVTKDVEPYAVVAGIPAKVIKKKFSEQQITELLKLQWWNYGPNILNGIYLGDIDAAIDEIKKRIQDGFPVYESEYYLIDKQNNTLAKYKNKSCVDE